MTKANINVIEKYFGERCYTTSDVADIIGVHERTVKEYVKNGKLNSVKVGGYRIVRQSDIDAFFAGDVAQ